MKRATETKKVTRTVVGLNREALEPLLRHEGGLALSLYMPVQFQTKKDAHEDAVRLRHLLQTAKAELLLQGVGESEAHALLRTAEELAAGEVLGVKAPGTPSYLTPLLSPPDSRASHRSSIAKSEQRRSRRHLV